MTRYARYIDKHTVQPPDPKEFKGVPNYLMHDSLLRRHNYLPLVGEPEPRLGVTAEPAEYALQGDHIQITAWTYVPIEPPEPAPLPTQFSKGTLLEALQACNLYEQAKAIYANDMDLQIAWAGFADIDMDYKATQDIMAKYPELFTEENVQMLREWIRDNQ
ncbi:MAG: hypothetical protein IJS08_16995 [Victivallales bacterium]|nr:hypothetical protein [Victivallales bacterium]